MNAERGMGNAAPARGGRVLVCFAVREEARHFQPPPDCACQVVISGIGASNAKRALLGALTAFTPELVLTCGYAGGLSPDLPMGKVIFDADESTELKSHLIGLGAAPVQFFCANRIAVTVAQKHALRHQTGADAVEMESGVVRAVCRERGIPAATVRVISDDAHTDLPLDFNQLAKADGNISYGRLAVALVKSPGLVPKLMRFQRELAGCSRRLGDTLRDLLVRRAG
jgi:adenosylhomocysteine nucleosidase